MSGHTLASVTLGKMLASLGLSSFISEMQTLTLASVFQLIGHHPVHQEVVGSIPSQGHMLG